KMVARPERPSLRDPPGTGFCRDRTDVGLFHGTTLLAPDKVTLETVACGHRPARPLLHHGRESSRGKFCGTLCPDTGRHGMVQGIKKLAGLFDIRSHKWRHKEPDPAVDVKANSTGGDDALVKGERSDATDRKPVAPRKGPAGQLNTEDTGKGGEVLQLLHCTRLEDCRECIGKEKPSRDP